MMYSRFAQPSQKCPMCGSSVTPGVIICPTCGEDLTKASMVVSTTIRPLSHSVKRRRFSASGVFYIAMAAIVVATAIVGLGYVPVVSARVPQLASLSTTVEDVVGQVMQWSRGMIGQPAAPTTKRPALNPIEPLRPEPVINKPAPPPKPVISKPAAPQKTAPKNQAQKPTKATPARPTAKTSPAAAAAPLLQIGSRAPQFAVKDLRGVIYRLSDYRGYRVAVLIVSSLDEHGRAAVRAYLDRFAFHPGYVPVIIITNPDRVAVRRLALASAGSRVAILLGDEELEAAYRLPKGGEALYVISERGAIAQAKAFGR